MNRKGLDPQVTMRKQEEKLKLKKTAKITRLPPNLASQKLVSWFGKVYSRVLGYP